GGRNKRAAAASLPCLRRRYGRTCRPPGRWDIENPMSAPAVILLIVEIYAAVGVVVALAFVAFGIARVLPDPMPVTPGARILVVPGAFALWPYGLARWWRARSAR